MTAGGTLFVDTDEGLYRREPGGFVQARPRGDALPPGPAHVTALARLGDLLVAGLQFAFDVPGFFNVAVALHKEWNHNGRVMPSGIGCLEGYHTKEDASTGVIKEMPVHDDTSHGCDALRVFAEADLRGLLDGTSAIAQESQQGKRDVILAGYRGRPPGDFAALARCLTALADFAWAERHHLAEIDVNPIVVSERGCAVVDALIDNANNAIHPNHRPQDHRRGPKPKVHAANPSPNRWGAPDLDQPKMLSGRKAETIQFGASTISLIERSTATLERI
jgi:hypothetical protein